LRRATHLPGDAPHGTRSPDGHKIAFARTATLGSTGDASTMDADGTTPVA
jgi:hypothetical protein